MKTFKFKKSARPLKINMPSRPVVQDGTEPEKLTGTVQDKKASAPEERLAKAYDQANIQYIFRYTFGAPKGLPGWKELDFVVSHNGLIYAQEVDTAFTHREKAYADVLHDALALHDFELNALGQLFPRVQHIDGDSDLANDANSKAFVKRTFGR